jgi:hypothetical protein
MDYFDKNPEDFTRFALGENIGGISIYPNNVKYFFPCTENGGNMIYDVISYNPKKLTCTEDIGCDDDLRCSRLTKYINCDTEAVCEEEIECSGLDTVAVEITGYYNYPERDMRKKSCAGAQDIKFLSTPSNLPILFTEESLNFKGRDVIRTGIKLRGSDKGIFIRFSSALNPIESLTKDRYYIYSDNFRLFYRTDTQEYILEFGDISKVLSLDDKVLHDLTLNYTSDGSSLEIKADSSASNVPCIFTGTDEINFGNKELNGGHGIYAMVDKIILSEETLQ